MRVGRVGGSGYSSQVTGDAPPEGPDGGDHRDLTPEEREKLRRIADSLQGLALPRLDFKIPTSSTPVRSPSWPTRPN